MILIFGIKAGSLILSCIIGKSCFPGFPVTRKDDHCQRCPFVRALSLCDRRCSPWIAATVCILIAASAIIPRIAWQPGVDWKVTTLSGIPTINKIPLEIIWPAISGRNPQNRCPLASGAPDGIDGRIEVDPDTSLRLFGTRSGHQRFSLQSGKVTALIWAPPFTLFVETPSATAIDLGCGSTLQVAPGGSDSPARTGFWKKRVSGHRCATSCLG